MDEAASGLESPPPPRCLVGSSKVVRSVIGYRPWSSCLGKFLMEPVDPAGCIDTPHDFVQRK